MKEDMMPAISRERLADGMGVLDLAKSNLQRYLMKLSFIPCGL